MVHVIAPGGYPREDRYPGGSPDADPLTGLASQVRDSQIKSLLTGRPPDLLERPQYADLLKDIKRGVAAEIAQLIKIAVDKPIDAGITRDLATWAVALGVAANIESSLFPEQQLGDDSRSQQLQARYLGVRAQLVALADEGADGIGAGAANAPQAGGFTPPQPWPDSPPAWPAAAWYGYPGTDAGWGSSW